MDALGNRESSIDNLDDFHLMICKHCGTEIADKALICYRCGAAVAEPRLKPRPSTAHVPVVPVVLGVLLLALVALFVWQSASGAPPETLVWIMIAAAAALIGWRFLSRLRPPGC